MTTDVSKRKKVNTTGSDLNTKKTLPKSNSENRKKSAISTHKDRRINGYTRIKSGELKRRSVSRTPDMSKPYSKVLNPNVAIGALGNASARQRSLPVAAVRTEPVVRTVSAPRKEAFPVSIVFLSIICSVLFMYMIFNYVQINESTNSVSELKNEIATLSVEYNDLSAKLEKKNDLNFIEKMAVEEYGMVKLEEISKKYIIMDSQDVMSSFETKRALPIN